MSNLLLWSDLHEEKTLVVSILNFLPCSNGKKFIYNITVQYFHIIAQDGLFSCKGPFLLIIKLF